MMGDLRPLGLSFLISHLCMSADNASLFFYLDLENALMCCIHIIISNNLPGILDHYLETCSLFQCGNIWPNKCGKKVDLDIAGTISMGLFCEISK